MIIMSVKVFGLYVISGKSFSFTVVGCFAFSSDTLIGRSETDGSVGDILWGWERGRRYSVGSRERLIMRMGG